MGIMQEKKAAIVQQPEKKVEPIRFEKKDVPVENEKVEEPKKEEEPEVAEAEAPVVEEAASVTENQPKRKGGRPRKTTKK